MTKKNNATVSSTLPDVLIVEILARLPLRSVLRLKCVSKSWFSLISDPQFAKIHYDLAAAPTYRVLKFLNPFEANSVSIDEDDDDSADVVFNIPFSSLLTKTSEYPLSPDIVGCCRGFILLKFRRTDWVVWNPSTRVMKRISCNLQWIDGYLYGFGYDALTDDFVVAVVKRTVVDCFSLRSNSWSFGVAKSNVDYDVLYELHTNEGLVLNGALHWGVCHDFEIFDYVILAFDITEKRLFEIPMPQELGLCHDLSNENVEHGILLHHVTVMGECLCIFVQRYNWDLATVWEMWSMKEYNVESSWSKLFVFSVAQNPSIRCFRPLCFTKNGEMLGLTEHKNRLMRMNEKGELFEHHGKYSRIPGCFVHAVYRKNLLSLPGGDTI